MSFFSWFSSKALQTQHAGKSGYKSQRAQSVRTLSQGAGQEGKHHGDREHLYEAIREAMTRAGILSASYKFKVLALDQQPSSFLVMIDLTKTAGDTTIEPREMETLIAESAKVRHGINVHAVYWRLNGPAAVNKQALPFASAVPAPPVQSMKKKEIAPELHEPIQADEVLAFQRALLAASAHGAPASIDRNAKIPRSGLRSSAHPMDFQDTEVAVQSTFYPALSSTQYGDLN
ncbi:MAG: hypothetical protein JWR60_936 [Polaromonas sp.]|nr:hypothetical protein [Polaromonas sp.]